MLDEIMLYVRTLQLGNLIEKLGVLKHNILEDKKFILIINENSKKCSPEFLTSLINILLLIYSVRIDRKKINKKKTEILEELKEAFDKWREKDKAINQTKSVKTLTSDIIKQLNEFSNDHNEITYDKVFSLIQSTFNNKCNTEKIEGAVQKLFSEHTHDQAIPLLNLYIKSNDNVTKTPDAAYNFSPVQKVLDFINEIEENEKAQKNKIEKETQNKYYPCVVLDGLNILTDQEKKVLNLNQIIKTLKKKVFFSILVYDGNTDRDLYQDYLADMVIELRGEEKIQPVHYFLHDLQISKSRFQSAAYGWHQYKIREFGLQVYKSVHFHLHINKYMDNQLTDSFQAITYSPKIEIAKTKGKNKTNTERIFNTSIEKILNAPIPGSFTVILGPRATFKTALTLKFLYNSAVVKDEENKDTKDGDSLLVSVVDNLGTLHNACKCPRSKLDKEEIRVKRNCKLCHEHFYIFHLRPGCITPDEFFHYLECRIKEHKSICRKDITRLAFWDLTQLEYRFPLFLSDSMFLPGLIGFGKKNKIAMIVMGAGNSALTPAASAVADNVIFTWRDENKKEKNNGVLAVYVDRCEGKLGQEGKELTYLNIEENKQVLQLDCPKIENTDKKFYTCNETDLGNAKKMIRDITDMQGMGGVKNGSEESTEKQSIEKTAKVAS